MRRDFNRPRHQADPCLKLVNQKSSTNLLSTYFDNLQGVHPQHWSELSSQKTLGSQLHHPHWPALSGTPKNRDRLSHQSASLYALAVPEASP